jgi:hypothetical protein
MFQLDIAEIDLRIDALDATTERLDLLAVLAAWLPRSGNPFAN